MKNQAYFIAAQAGLRPIAWGMPGTCKTQTIYAFARALRREAYTLIGALRDPAEIGGYPHPGEYLTQQGEQRVVMRLVPPEYAQRVADGSIGIVFVDELTTCAPAVQAALLRVMAEGVVGDLPLPSSTLILSAANPPDQAANGIDLEPPMANRLIHLDWEMDWDAWRAGLLAGLEFPEPLFPIVPANFTQHLPAHGGLVAAFQRVKPGLFADYPKDRSRATKAWPSPRSWTNAVTALAAAQGAGVAEEVSFQLVSGCVGEPAAIEFFEWKRNLDLPDPETLLHKAASAMKSRKPMDYDHPGRADKVIAMLSSLVAAVTQDKTEARWHALLMILERAAEHEIDVAMSLAAPIAKMREKAWKFPDGWAERMFPRLKVLMQ